MDSLHICTQAYRLTSMYKIANNHTDIDPQTYLHNTNNQRTHNTHNQKYQTYHTNTDTYKHSYFPRTIHDWNRLSQRILDSKQTHSQNNFTQTCHLNILTDLHKQLYLIHSPPCKLGAPLLPTANSICMCDMHQNWCPRHYSEKIRSVNHYFVFPTQKPHIPIDPQACWR